MLTQTMQTNKAKGGLLSKVLQKEKGKAGARVLTKEEVEDLIERVKVGLKEHMLDTRKEEPGLSEKARHFVIKY